ncbi:N-acetyltransferase [Neobacillus sp. DY30]|uniref:GNAT family N-acetyltransferase n=1 Tax=Neobacillus sp. DY30 TaxID=3047871 RepID=UPI0024C020F0|nr:N-acetyltransferase [Neobacillus sp. DY30]WHY01187.1 N-acetyltransferase [Neobacillus sp. DY30]
MDRNTILALFNQHLRIGIIEPDSRRERTDSVIRKVSLSNEPGFISYSEMDESNADKVIEEQITYYRNLKQQFEWKVFDYDQPSDLKERLRKKGFTLEESEALMISDLTETNQLLETRILPEVKRLTTEQNIWDIIKLEEEVWNVNYQELGQRLVRDFNDSSAHLSLYGAYVDGKIVSAAWMYLHTGTPFASLWGGSTLADYRTRGLYSSLLAIRAHEASQKDYPLLIVDASSMSKPILEKHGFHCYGYSTPCMSPKFD